MNEIIVINGRSYDLTYLNNEEREELIRYIQINNPTQTVLQWPRPEIQPPTPEEEREKSELIERRRREEEIRRRFGTETSERVLKIFGMK